MSRRPLPVAPGRRRPRRPDDEGSTLVLAVFYTALALVLILVVAAATSLYIERKRLYSLADAAAAVGAEAFTIDGVTGGDGTPVVSLDSSAVDVAVTAFLSETDSGGIEDLRIEDASSPDGTSASVTLSGYWRPPVITAFVPEGIRLEVTSVARSVFR